ncbi:MAG: type II secretion system protein GspF [Betaproteobacteria bacterium]|nr:type II secretion system protein GspF [Betaproteobacteria bacterium]NBY05386.1 type II secretion system protein GspF [Betaproteobacteria bacterium]
MPAYTYQALDAQGHAQNGVVEADSARAARNQLRAQALVPLTLAALGPSDGQTTGQSAWRSAVLSRTELTTWTRQLAGLVGAGLPLERALSALADEAEQTRHRHLVAALRAEVNAGSSFAQALAEHPRQFPLVYRSVVAAGEQSGHLGEVLERLANDLEQQQTLRAKLMAATLYPAIVSSVAILIVLFLLAYVVPQVATVFQSSQRSLPTLTVVMLAISHAVQTLWVYAALALVAGAVLLRQALRQPPLRLRWDALWLRLPLVGPLARGYNAARFASTLAMLAGAGVPILRALHAAADTLANQALRADALQAEVLVREGAPLAQALAQHRRLPSLLAMFVRQGEQTGRLPDMLQRCADQLGNDVQRRAMQLATLLEPLLIVAMGGLVMLIVLAVMLPIIQLNQWVR